MQAPINFQNKLPKDVWGYLFSFCNINQVAILSLVSKTFYTKDLRKVLTINLDKHVLDLYFKRFTIVTHLTIFNFKYSSMLFNSVNILKNFNKMTHLKIYDNMTYSQLYTICHDCNDNMKKIKYLNLSNNNIGNNYNMSYLNNNNNYNMSYLNKNNNNNNHITTSLENVKELNISSNNIGPNCDNFYNTISKLQNLEILDISHNKIDIEGLLKLSYNSRPGSITWSISSNLALSLLDLNISNNCLSSPNLYFTTFKCLQKLDLSHNNLNSNILMILDNLNNVKKLKYLKINNNYINKNYVKLNLITSLVNLIKSTQIINININDNNFIHLGQYIVNKVNLLVNKNILEDYKEEYLEENKEQNLEYVTKTLEEFYI
jgi:hypothetical protein